MREVLAHAVAFAVVAVDSRFAVNGIDFVLRIKHLVVDAITAEIAGIVIGEAGIRDAIIRGIEIDALVAASEINPAIK